MYTNNLTEYAQFCVDLLAEDPLTRLGAWEKQEKLSDKC